MENNRRWRLNLDLSHCKQSYYCLGEDISYLWSNIFSETVIYRSDYIRDSEIYQSRRKFMNKTLQSSCHEMRWFEKTSQQNRLIDMIKPAAILKLHKILQCKLAYAKIRHLQTCSMHTVDEPETWIKLFHFQNFLAINSNNKNTWALFRNQFLVSEGLRFQYL